MAVSLSEIANIKGDADLAQGGFGTDAILPENNTALAYLQNAANLQAGANKYLAEVHNQRMQDYLNNFRNIDLKNLAPGDYDPLSNQYINLAKDISDNYDVIQNPLKNKELAASLMAREAALRSQISQSQMDRGIMEENNKFVQAHPDFNTEDYQKKVQDYWNTPLGQRRPFALNPAYVFNPADIAKKAYDAVKQKYATATTDGKYVFTQEGLKAAAPDYLKAYNTLLSSDDSYGRTARAAMLNAWNQLSPEDKAQYGNDPQKWSNTQALALMTPDQQEKAKLDENQYGTIAAQGAQTRKNLSMEEAFQAHQNELNRENQLEIAGLKGKDAKFDKNAVGEYKNKLYHDFFTGTGTDNIQPVDLNRINNDPNRTPTDKIAVMDRLTQEALNNASYGRNIPNEVLQNIYGDNAKVKHIVGDKNTAEGQYEEMVPKETVIGNRVANNGTALITIKNNQNGRIHQMYIPREKFYDDLDHVLGEKYAPQVSQASREWLQKNTGSDSPDIEKLKALVNPSSQASTLPQVSSDEQYKSLPKGAQYIAPDGKTYTKK
jgi:hypothetical protein